MREAPAFFSNVERSRLHLLYYVSESKGEAPMPRPRPGYEYHEIVEQSDWNNHLARGSIDPGRNRVLIPTYRHWDVNAFYATPQNEYGGMSPRSYLRGKSAEECYRVGLDALRRLGVLK